jgi:hypothetical protein
MALLALAVAAPAVGAMRFAPARQLSSYRPAMSRFGQTSRSQVLAPSPLQGGWTNLSSRADAPCVGCQVPGHTTARYRPGMAPEYSLGLNIANIIHHPSSPINIPTQKFDQSLVNYNAFGNDPLPQALDFATLDSSFQAPFYSAQSGVIDNSSAPWRRFADLKGYSDPIGLGLSMATGGGTWKGNASGGAL